MVPTSLIGKNVGLEEIGERGWRINFRQQMFRYVDEAMLRCRENVAVTKATMCIGYTVTPTLAFVR